MNKVDLYLNAGARENTRKSYRAAIEHFEVEWGGYLPATGDGIVKYLANYAGKHAISTLKQRLAALSQWHVSQGFPDPTKTPDIRRLLKGIRAVHPTQTKQATALQLSHLQSVITWLEAEVGQAQASSDHKSVIRHRRSIALILIGFWRGFRGDELARLRIEDTHAIAGEGITFFLPFTKNDREHQGTQFHTPALKLLCPVEAYINWTTAAGLVRGPVFRGIDRWGNMSERAINPHSLIPMLRKIFSQAGLPSEMYSSHSLRRGFATWASANGWDIKALMTYVGWRDLKSAIRYVDASASFAGLALTATNQAADLDANLFIVAG